MSEFKPILEKGTKAPLFTKTTSSGESISLKALKGSRVALYFYPKDDTPGCTKQACNIQENWNMLKEQGVNVVGVSPDESHEAFEEKYGLSFPLVSDPNKKLMEKYGVWGEKKLYGKVSIGVKRTTFLIDENGVIVDVIKRPKVVDHAAEILRRFDKALK